jgi:uncharacterized SAM-binding protein YcdF (DUF218 family)
MSIFNNYKRLPTRLYRQYNQHLIRLLVGIVIALILYTLVNQLAHNHPHFTNHNSSDIRPENVAIIILGGGLLTDGSVPPHTMLRIERAIQLFQDTYQKKATIITLSGGTPHKPNPLDQYGFPVWEASAAAKKLIELGVPSEHVFEENFSLDTVGNVSINIPPFYFSFADLHTVQAYFLRAIHMLPGNYQKMIVITNRWHMPRTQAIFERVFSLPLKSSSSSSPDNNEHDHSVASSMKRWFSWCADDSSLIGGNLQLEFDAVGDGIGDAEVLSGRNAREKASLESFLAKVSPQWYSFSQLHTWMFTKHQAYASERLAKAKTVEMDPAVLKSY